MNKLLIVLLSVFLMSSSIVIAADEPVVIEKPVNVLAVLTCEDHPMSYIINYNTGKSQYYDVMELMLDLELFEEVKQIIISIPKEYQNALRMPC